MVSAFLSGVDVQLSLPMVKVAAKLLRETAPKEMKDEGRLYFRDPYTTAEQEARDKEITRLLKAYVRGYEGKVRHSVWCRYLILGLCIAVIGFFSFGLGWFSWRMVNAEGGMKMADLASFITACLSFLGLLVGVLVVITKYFFPENDEQYITQIVKSIQENDLANKQNAKTGVSKQDPSQLETGGMAPVESEEDLSE